ncbi:MAG: hypothetical protein AAGI45_06915 [Cyanobacteria bacterium P01_H01_bin.26]
MPHFYEPTPAQPRIRWSWFALSCISLLSGFLYLATVDIVSPVRLSQTATEHQP